MEELYRNHHISQMHSNGTSAYKTFVAILPSSLITFITMLLMSLLSTYVTNQKKWQFLLSYICLVVPVILSITVLAEYLERILLALIVAASSLVFIVYNLKPFKLVVPTNCQTQSNYLTNARSTINILSIIAILAVDVPIFPRYFAKTESFGYSLMDVGVGLFMFSNGIVAPEARGRSTHLKDCIKSSLPLFVLGFARFIFVKQTDYNVPISEYGVHWNFFITLGMTKVVSAIIFSVIGLKHLFINTVFLLIFHETLLQKGLEEFTLKNKGRDSFIKANKEGLVSTLGYVCIYLLSIQFGHFLQFKSQSKNKYIIFNVLIFSLLALGASTLLQRYFGISRKLANSAYCFWVLFIGIFMTGLYYVQQILLENLYRDRLHRTFSPVIFEAINYNGLVFFLVGNLLTGLVNLAFETLRIPTLYSLAILAVYMLINCAIVTLLYYKRYKLKF